MNAVDRNTHLLDWLSDGWTHCQHGTKEWCEAYLHNAREVIKAQDDTLAAKDTALSEMAERLATAYRVKTECNDTANEERHLRLAAEAALAEMRVELEKALAIVRLFLAVEDETKGGLSDCIDNLGTPYQSQYFANIVSLARALSSQADGGSK